MWSGALGCVIKLLGGVSRTRRCLAFVVVVVVGTVWSSVPRSTSKVEVGGGCLGFPVRVKAPEF